jgi:hypothetical protein
MEKIFENRLIYKISQIIRSYSFTTRVKECSNAEKFLKRIKITQTR